MAANAQQFGGTFESRKLVNETSVREIYAQPTHPIEFYPTFQEGEYMNAFGFEYQPPRRYDPHSNMYNLDWKDHTNFNCAPRPSNFHYQGQFPPQRLVNMNEGTSYDSLEDALKILIANNLKFQQAFNTRFQSLETEVSQIANSISNLESQGCHHSLPEVKELFSDKKKNEGFQKAPTMDDALQFKCFDPGGLFPFKEHCRFKAQTEEVVLDNSD